MIALIAVRVATAVSARIGAVPNHRIATANLALIAIVVIAAEVIAADVIADVIVERKRE